MQTVILVGFLLLLAIGWIIDQVQQGAATAERRRKTVERLRELGIGESDLGTLLTRIPKGYLPSNLYRAKRRAESTTASKNRVDIAEAVLGLYTALESHRRSEEIAAVRRAEDAETARRLKAEEDARYQELMRAVEECGPPSREGLIVQERDYVRENEADRTFRRVYLLRLLALHENACAVCGSRENGLDLDHYFVPKSHGGNFVLTRRDGLRIGNAVPMCESCNRSKGGSDWQTFGTHEVRVEILRKNRAATKLMNEAGASVQRSQDR